MKSFTFLIAICLISFTASRDLPHKASVNNGNYWHNKIRNLRYTPDGQDFVIKNGTKRFTRALYGTNTGFRIEAGDLPEFALYMPGMGGNFKLGLIAKDTSKWVIDATNIVARYRPGSMLYEIKDNLLGKGRLNLTLLAMHNAEGMILKAEFFDVDSTVELFWAFGGATGKRFHRDGDIGADPESSFYLKPEYCTDNIYTKKNNHFDLYFGSGKILSESEFYRKQDGLLKNDSAAVAYVSKMKQVTGTVPPVSEMKWADAKQQISPAQFFSSKPSGNPVVVGKIKAALNQPLFFTLHNPKTLSVIEYRDIPELFKLAEEKREKLVNRIFLNTPDPYINTIGGALSVAADAIWEEPSYLHGAVAWRSRYNGWRGAYVADPLGWHERARTHFRSYAKSQLTEPGSGPVIPDAKLNFARQKEELGTAVFSSGYICRYPGGERLRTSHYDMNLVFIDELLQHFKWTGDIEFVKEMWPLLKRHLAWEKRCFDGDGDGLYDAYCCIWASDALQYSGGGVTHSSVYNYRANKMAAELAKMIAENPEPYSREAEKIYNAVNKKLWLKNKGWFAEYKDALGNQFVHPVAGLWTIYHAIDSGLPDAFQAYQMLRYVDTKIPHIPIKANGLLCNDCYTLSTTNWMPYTWSVNNVALAEVLHTSLAFWQGGRSEEAFQLWKSVFLESMYLGSSPGNFEQLSFYDAMRGELYRDFADPIGIAARTLVEGLFGINPDLLNRLLTIHPGLPEEWQYASLKIPDMSFDFKRSKNTDHYSLIPKFTTPVKLRFQVRAKSTSLKEVTVNGKKIKWKNEENAVGFPFIEINCSPAPRYEIEILWAGEKPEIPDRPDFVASSDTFRIKLKKSNLLEIFDPQKVFKTVHNDSKNLTTWLNPKPGNHTVFIKIQQGDLTWWSPVDFEIRNPVNIIAADEQDKSNLKFRIQNNTSLPLQGKLTVNPGKNEFTGEVELGAKSSSSEMVVNSKNLVQGKNIVYFEWGKNNYFQTTVSNWLPAVPTKTKWETINLSEYFNDKVTNIFKNEYRTPRSPYPTLQLPLQGIGNWCSPMVKPSIDDSGLRTQAGVRNEFILPQGIPFNTPGNKDSKNILFTSLWDNYPDSAVFPLTGKASHAYFMLAGSTNPMQSQFDNGRITIKYVDGSTSTLLLKNPDNWWPIEQDYYIDEYAFSINGPKPLRVYLKTGQVNRNFSDYVSIKGFSDYAVNGGAATVLDLPLDNDKELKELHLKTLANDVVIGLMAVTLKQSNTKQ